MASIKIWECDPPEITEIVFSENNSHILKSDFGNMIRLCDEEGDCILVYKKDIPYLIKALEKAQEIWS